MSDDRAVDNGTLLPTENTSLLEEVQTNTELSPLPESATSSSEVVRQQLWEELEHPWPSTFERSISLLASPILPAKQAALYTKSPKPGATAVALARRGHLDRGQHHTPEGRSPFFARFRRNGSDAAFDAAFEIGVTKVQSLDFFKNKATVEKVQAEQAKRIVQAQEYRKKILQKQDAEKGEKEQPVRKKTDQRAKPVVVDGKATIWQCAFNLANILMGLGILSLPYVFFKAGWYGGLFCIFTFALITWRTTILIGRELNGDPRPSSFFHDSPFKSPLRPGMTPAARMLPPITSFPDIARSSFGEVGSLLLSIVLYFELFSCISIFLVSMGDHLHELFPSIPATRHACWVAAVSLIPTIVLRTPALLSYLSMVGTFATLAVVVAVITSAIVEGDISERVAEEKGLTDAVPYHTGWRTEGLTLAFGLVAYCFSGHAIIPSIYKSMEKPQEFEKMVTLTFLVVVVCCLAVALSGYYMFGSTVLDQVTLSLKQSSQAVLAMKALTWLMIMTSFSKLTLTMFPLALGLEEIIAPYLTSEGKVAAASSTIKVTLTILALLVSIFVPSFSLLCALVGMICTMVVSVCFPAAAHLKMFGSRLSATEKLVDWAFIVVGTVMAIVGTIATL